MNNDNNEMSIDRTADLTGEYWLTYLEANDALINADIRNVSKDEVRKLVADKLFIAQEKGLPANEVFESSAEAFVRLEVEKIPKLTFLDKLFKGIYIVLIGLSAYMLLITIVSQIHGKLVSFNLYDFSRIVVFTLIYSILFSKFHERKTRIMSLKGAILLVAAIVLVVSSEMALEKLGFSKVIYTFNNAEAIIWSVIGIIITIAFGLFTKRYR